MIQRSRFCAFGASNCHGSTSRAVATFAIQSSVGLVADLSTAKTCERETPAKSARAVKATPFRFDAKRTFRATSARKSRGSTLRTVGRLRHRGIRYPGLFYAPEARMGRFNRPLYFLALTAVGPFGCSSSPSPPATNVGCAKDTDCKGTRICVSGVCTNPSGELDAMPDGTTSSDALTPDATSDGAGLTGMVESGSQADAFGSDADAQPGVDSGQIPPGELPDPNCPTGIHTTVSGTVYNFATDAPIPGVTVYAPKSAALPVSFVPYPPFYGSAVTDQTGHFVVSNVPPGTDVPLVLQSAQWRQEFLIPGVKKCVDNPQADQTIFGGPTVLPTVGDAGPLSGCVTSIVGVTPGYCQAIVPSYDVNPTPTPFICLYSVDRPSDCVYLGAPTIEGQRLDVWCCAADAGGP
jgi:hypothetical protein